MNWLGLDVGGANLKLAAADRSVAVSRSFAMWTQWKSLAGVVAEMVRPFATNPLALTMTGELADCFALKADGVRHIVTAVREAIGARPLLVYRHDNRWVDAAQAIAEPVPVAAANWHALASWAGRLAPQGPAIVIDIGSTTSDLIPLVNGRPIPTGHSDPERLVSGELVYTGVVRSPVCAVASTLPRRGAACPTAQERFATTRDAYLLLGDLPERADDMETADGRPATKYAAWGRLARAICCDRSEFTQEDALVAAQAIERAQLARLGIALQNVGRRLGSAPQTIILAGQGEFLARRLLVKSRWQPRVVSLAEELGGPLSEVAPAYAVAVLASEHS